jgi:hypothetical protein
MAQFMTKEAFDAIIQESKKMAERESKQRMEEMIAVQLSMSHIPDDKFIKSLGCRTTSSSARVLECQLYDPTSRRNNVDLTICASSIFSVPISIQEEDEVKKNKEQIISKLLECPLALRALLDDKITTAIIENGEKIAATYGIDLFHDTGELVGLLSESAPMTRGTENAPVRKKIARQSNFTWKVALLSVLSALMFVILMVLMVNRTIGTISTIRTIVFVILMVLLTHLYSAMVTST